MLKEVHHRRPPLSKVQHVWRRDKDRSVNAFTIINYNKSKLYKYLHHWSVYLGVRFMYTRILLVLESTVQHTSSRNCVKAFDPG